MAIMKTRTRKEETIRLTFATPQKRITTTEKRERQFLVAALETLVADFESRFHTDVVEIELHPCDCRVCRVCRAA